MLASFAMLHALQFVQRFLFDRQLGELNILSQSSAFAQRDYLFLVVFLQQRAASRE